ncbi:MAG: hypothetical protein JSV62_04175 [Promethearchaeota archaeon]|nr:MAG: hypothetical protein JSV62_04175 [Candidatus Lokiarchaeota archaeon]
MKLVCRDCTSTIMVTDKRLKSCPQCGSANVDFVLRNGSIYHGKTQQSSMDTLAKVKIIFWIMGISGLILIIIAGSLDPLTFTADQLGTNILIVGALLLAIPIVFAVRKGLPDCSC